MQRFALGLLYIVSIWVSAVAVASSPGIMPGSIEDAYLFCSEEESGNLQLLGRGTIANVYLAKEKGSDRDVAIRNIEKKQNGSEIFATWIKRERDVLRLQQSLRHAHILPILALYESDDRLDAVLPYMGGGDLLGLLERLPHGRMPERNAREYWPPILAGLKYLHDHGIIHRDIKPENILLRNDYTPEGVMIADFDFATQAVRVFPGEGRLGTFAYMAPEIHFDQPYDKTVDIWAVTVTLYVLVTGCFPFGALGTSDAPTVEERATLRREKNRLKTGRYHTGPVLSTLSDEIKCLFVLVFMSHIVHQPRLTCDQLLDLSYFSPKI